MLVLNSNPRKPPKGGVFTYSDAGLSFGDKDFDKLILAVAFHEAYKLLTVAEVTQKVLAYLAIHDPEQVVVTQNPDKVPEGQIQLRDWLATLDAEKMEYRENADYLERREVCLACQFNDVVELDAEAKRKLYLLSRGYVDDRLGICRKHGHHNALACWLNMPHKAEPAWCWLQI